MALIVQKFGGSSVGNLECIQFVADKIIQTKAQGHDVVAVVSAMYGETDRLINMAKTIHENPNPREYAALVSTGEQVSIALLSMALTARGCMARSYTGAQAQITTDDQYKKARILHIDDKILRADINAGFVPVVAGFQGICETGDITTLGRGGSDTTAVALAAALQADECQIYTDVDGVYTADPKIVPNAHRLDQVTFSEMLEFASSGAKVLQHRAVEFAGKYQIPVRVLSTFHQGKGTLICTDKIGMEQPLVTGIAINRQALQITLQNLPKENTILIGKILTEFNHHQIEVSMLTQQNYSLCFTINNDDKEKAFALLQNICDPLNINISLGLHKAKLSVIGVGLQSHAIIIESLFKILGTHGIEIYLIASSEIKLSLVIDDEKVDQAAQLLHAAFGLDQV